MKQRFLPILTAALLGAALAGGCSKTSETAAVTPPVINPPTVTAPDYTTWKLSSLTVNSVPQTLTSMQASFKMTMYNDGRYADTDGAAGSWSMIQTDSLTINKANLPKPIVSRYKKIAQSKTSLVLQSTQENTEIQMTYEAN